jgi:hypothetical protein
LSHSPFNGSSHAGGTCSTVRGNATAKPSHRVTGGWSAAGPWTASISVASVNGSFATAKGRRFVKLMGLTKAAKEMLRVTKLSFMFTAYQEEEDAVQSFA